MTLGQYQDGIYWGGIWVCIGVALGQQWGGTGASWWPWCHLPCVPPARRRWPLPRRWTRWPGGARRRAAALIPRGGDKWEVTRVCVDGYLW